VFCLQAIISLEDLAPAPFDLPSEGTIERESSLVKPPTKDKISAFSQKVWEPPTIQPKGDLAPGGQEASSSSSRRARTKFRIRSSLYIARWLSRQRLERHRDLACGDIYHSFEVIASEVRFGSDPVVRGSDFESKTAIIIRDRHGQRCDIQKSVN